MIVREATLDDTQDIVGTHLTNPDRPFDRPIEELSVAERYSYGGPWMSVESCAIHLNNMLAWGYVPLVVEDEGKVIAEAEFYIGKDVPPLGTTLDISVLYVHSDFQRRGAGSLLVQEMISRAKREKCHYVTVSGGLGALGSTLVLVSLTYSLSRRLIVMFQRKQMSVPVCHTLRRTSKSSLRGLF